MYLIRSRSLHTADPLFMRIPTGQKTFFIPMAKTAKDYANTGLYEEGYIDWAVQNFAKEDKAFLDIGAHIGHYTISFAPRVKQVHAFECSPKSFNYLCANIALHDLHYRVKTYNVALSDKETTVDYFIRSPEDGGGNGISKFEKDERNKTPSIPLSAKPLDTFGLTNLNFIKLDVEGHEEFVLRGGVKTLEENDYPKLLFESWAERIESEGVPARELRKSLFGFLESLEYKIVQVRGCTDDMFLAERA